MGSEMCIRDSMNTDHVVFRPLHDAVPPMLIALAWRADRPSPAVRAVLDVADEVLPTPINAEGA